MSRATSSDGDASHTTEQSLLSGSRWSSFGVCDVGHNRKCRRCSAIRNVTPTPFTFGDVEATVPWIKGDRNECDVCRGCDQWQKPAPNEVPEQREHRRGEYVKWRNANEGRRTKPWAKLTTVDQVNLSGRGSELLVGILWDANRWKTYFKKDAIPQHMWYDHNHNGVNKRMVLEESDDKMVGGCIRLFDSDMTLAERRKRQADTNSLSNEAADQVF